MENNNMKNKKAIIAIIVAVVVIGIGIAVYVISNMKAVQEHKITENLNTFVPHFTYEVIKDGNLPNITKNEVVKLKDYVCVMFYFEENLFLGIELDKNADKIIRTYGNSSKLFESFLRKHFENRLAPDFVANEV